MTAHARGIQADSLIQDAMEVLRSARSVKNSLVPINQIPPEVISLVPDYNCGHRADKDLIALTHVCRSWRDTFTSRSSLWTRLCFKDINKTCTYIQRSQYSPLEFRLGDDVIDGAFSSAVPHIRRLKSLTINGKEALRVLKHFRCHVPPLLEKLDIYVDQNRWRLNSAPFNGDLPSLQELRLCGATTNCHWKNLANLRIVRLRSVFPPHTLTHLLDFFESAPLLHTVSLEGSIEGSPVTPPDRMVSLCHLKVLTIRGKPQHSILLNRLHIPVGASLTSQSETYSEEFPYPDYFPERSPNLENLSRITAINLFFSRYDVRVRLSGPSGSLCILVHWWDLSSLPFPARPQVFRFLAPTIPTIERLAVSSYPPTNPMEGERCPIFQTLSSANHLRTLTLAQCDCRPFTRALDPEENPSDPLLCPTMEELVLYAEFLPPFYVDDLIKMAKNRASRGVKLPSITIVDMSGGKQVKGVFKLRDHVTHVEYRVGGSEHAWDDVPGESSGGSK